MSPGLAAVLTAVATYLLFPARAAGGEGSRTSPLRPAVVVAASGVMALALASSAQPLDLALGVILGAAGLGAANAQRRHRAQVRARARSALVLATCEALAAELSAGEPSLRALERAGGEWSEFHPVVAAARLGADVPGALRELARLPGADQLAWLAAAWQVAHRVGGGLAESVNGAALGLRSEAATIRMVQAELASAQATARLLAALPFGVLLLGTGVGGDPIGFLTRTPLGLGALVAGLGLSYAGLRWLQQIADRVLMP